MQMTSKTVHGAAFDLIIEEAKSVDAQGGLLGYLASFYVRERGQTTFLRKSRLPETAILLAAAVQHNDMKRYRQLAV